MKKNTQRILLSLYLPTEEGEENTYLPYGFIYDLFPQYTESGLRSIVNLLIKKNYVLRLTRNNQTLLYLSQIGVSKVLEAYPSLQLNYQKGVKSAFSVCCCYAAPEHDPQFRKLRLVCLKYSGYQIMRGVYLFPFDPLPSEFFYLLLNKYSSNVVVMSLRQFSLGDPKLFSGLTQPLHNSHRSLSEISEMISQLLAIKAEKKVTIYREKSKILNTFANLEEMLTTLERLPPEEINQQKLLLKVFTQWAKAARRLYFHTVA